MDPIAWNNSLRVGVAKLDRQHKQLIDSINYLLEHDSLTTERQTVLEVLGMLTNYAAYHFQTEEQILTEYGYPDLRTQQEEHREFKLRTAKFCADAMAPDGKLRSELLTYLRQWVTVHLMEEDMKYKAFLKKKVVR